MSMKCSASALLYVALNDNVSLPSAFQGVKVQLFEGDVVIFTDSFDFPDEGLLNLFQLLDVSFVNW